MNGLEDQLGRDRLQEDVPLAPFTTFRIGGPADLFFQARTASELATVLELCRAQSIPFFLLGRGANILVGDRGFRGLVIHSQVGGIEFLPDSRVQVGSGVILYPELIRETVQKGLGGLHHFVGIPSTVGGAMWQNLHFLSPAPERERTVFLEEVVHSAEIVSEGGTREVVPREYFQFGYDYSILHDRGDVVLSVIFSLNPTPKEDLHRVMEENLQWRLERHPDLNQLPSAGSIFQKLEGIGAGRLIDSCGLKGRMVGGAQVFPGHANIIVNRGGASATDVVSLIEEIQTVVLARLGHTLVPEITLVGEF
jgi:UDP-N-acetylmuramate dehydrogenase